ncbi:hypothetical protein OKA04_22280 [Luteolibacter flavescens]|uniref:Uncharacterized protein n=1 Tax=Luteolibacter flavescens TaxID=1859460 RepID=A0ABT3FV70_9BACT|nr:hypothetical protein [Luteolibacter flavescens]MCW1887480.1 hypothetical protein [Luteolibacter flavescens]
MTGADFAVTDAAARSTGKHVRVEDGKKARPLYQNRDSKVLSQVSFFTPLHPEHEFDSFVGGFTGGTERRGGKMTRRTQWSYRGVQVTEQLHDYGPGAKHGLQYCQSLFARLPKKVVIVESMAVTSDPSKVKGDDLMKSILASQTTN